MTYGLRLAKMLRPAGCGLLPVVLAAALLIWGATACQAADWGIRVKDHKAKPQGAQVSRISSGSPADRAGLKKGDIIIAVNGEKVRSASRLAAMLKKHPSAKPLLLMVNRKGWSNEITLMPPKSAGAAKSGKTGAGLGAQYEDAPQNAKPGHGALLGRISPKGPAARAGLGKGDVITYFNGHKIFTAEDLDQVLAKLTPGQKVSLSISRQGWEKDLELKLGREKTGTKPRPKPAPSKGSASPTEGGYLGIDMTNAPGDKDGVLVKKVYKNSPAQKAGIRTGDIIIFFNGRKVFEGWDIVEETSSQGPGARMEVSVLRGGKELDLDVVLGRIRRAKSARPQQTPPPQPQPPAADSSGDVHPGWLGVHLSNTTPQQGGAKVAKVLPNGPAHMAGLKAGDIITMVNGRKINETRDLVLAIKILPPGSRVQISLLRNGRGMVLHPVLAQRPPDAGTKGRKQKPGAKSIFNELFPNQSPKK